MELIEKKICIIWFKQDNISNKRDYSSLNLITVVQHFREKKFRLKNQTQYPLKLKLEVRDESHVFKVNFFYMMVYGLFYCLLLKSSRVI